MTTTAIATTSSNNLVRRQPKKHSVKWLERELAEARADLQIAGRRIDVMSIALMGKRELLAAVLNQRDEAYNERDRARDERDSFRVQRDEVKRLAQKDWATHLANECDLQDELSQVRDFYKQLGEVNQRNFDMGVRRGDVAAILACMVAEDNPPAEAMIRIAKVAAKMNIDPDVMEDVRTALKRGYAAQVDEVVNTASGMEPEDSTDMLQNVFEPGMPYGF